MTDSTKAIPMEIVDGVFSKYQRPEDLTGENGLIKQLTKALVERVLEAEMAEHLGHAKNEAVSNPTGNTRNGKSKKTLKGEFGEMDIYVPRDREGSFEPQLIPKYKTRFTNFDEQIIALYARGMTTRQIQSYLEEMYGADVSPTLISNVTDAVNDEVKAWQQRPLDEVYPIVYMDCIHVKIRDTGSVRAKAVYLAIGINMEGEKEMLGIWIAQTEGAKFWLQVVTELKNRGVQDIFKLRAFKVQESELSFLNLEQIATLIERLATSKNPHVLMISRICLSTGARWGEAEGLRVSQIQNGLIQFVKTKSSKARSVPITADFEKALLNHYEKHGIGERLFATAYSSFREAIKATNLKLSDGQLTHILRHSFASHFMMNGGNILALQKLLGHYSLTMTMRYAHLSPDHLEEARRLNPIALLSR